MLQWTPQKPRPATERPGYVLELYEMQKHVAIVVDWFGPYDLESAKKAAKENFENGLYLLVGKAKYQKRSV